MPPLLKTCPDGSETQPMGRPLNIGAPFKMTVFCPPELSTMGVVTAPLVFRMITFPTAPGASSTPVAMVPPNALQLTVI